MTVPDLTGPSAADVEALRAHVGADATADGYLTECLTEAGLLVGRYIGTHEVPAEVTRRAVREVASELFHRRSAPGGVLAQFAEMGAAPVRLARDPMLGAYPLLARYLPAGIG